MAPTKNKKKPVTLSNQDRSTCKDLAKKLIEIYETGTLPAGASRSNFRKALAMLDNEVWRFSQGGDE